MIFLKRRDGEILETAIETSTLKHAQEYDGLWYAWWNPHTESFYVRANKKRSGKQYAFYLHRWILNAPQGLCVDHINHDTLDNRTINLRLATVGQNNQNKHGAQRNSTSGIRGVYWFERDQKWKVNFTINGVVTHIGYFDDKYEAEKVVKELRAKYMPFSEEAMVGGTS